MALPVEPDLNGPETDPERTLQEAAEQLGCHVETLRRRVRSGTLRARRGPHGAYLVRASALVGTWIQPLAGRQRRRLDEEESWAAVARLIHQYDRTHAEAMALLEDVRREPARRPRLARLIEVQRLRLSGLSYRELAGRLDISERQARRLAHRDPEVALRIQLTREARRRSDDHRRRARDLLATLEARIQVEGYEGRTRAEIVSAWPRTVGRLQRRLTIDEFRTLLSIGITSEELDAVALVGIPAEALGHLLTYGVGDREPLGH